MARRPGEDDRFSLSPRARRVGGWLVAIVLLVGIAFTIRLLGGNGDGTALVATPSPSGASADLPAIAFGTAIDPSTGEVAESARTRRFVVGDTFAYSVRPAVVPTEVYVEVLRGSESGEVVQSPTDAQALAAGAPAIAFSVPAANLLDAFGSGEFVMRIYLAPDGAPIASGSFELIPATPTASG